MILRVLIWSRNYERTSSEKILLGAKLSKFLDKVLRNIVGGVYIAPTRHPLGFRLPVPFVLFVILGFYPQSC